MAVTKPNAADAPSEIKTDASPVEKPSAVLALSQSPRDWSAAKRYYHTLATALMAFAVTFATSTYTPGVAEVEAYFGVSQTVALLPLAVYSIGLAVGPIIAAPCSEIFGRLIVYRIALPVCMLFTLGAGFSKTIEAFIVCRFFAAAAGGPVIPVGAGINADLYGTRDRATASCIYILAPFLGPSLAPVVGGYTAIYKGWRWTQWDNLFLAVPIFIISLGMEETYEKILDQRRMKKAGTLPAEAQVPTSKKVMSIFTFVVARPLQMLVQEPIVAFISLYVAFVFAVLNAFFAAIPYIFASVYGFNIGQSGLVFVGVGVGVILAVITVLLCDRLIYRKKLLKADTAGLDGLPPEQRLYPALLGSIGIPVGLFWLGWSSRRDVHWISPVLATIPFAWGNTCIFISTALYLVDTYGALYGASAQAANGFARYGLSAAFPLFVTPMYRQLGIGWASSVFGFISLLFLPLPWVLLRWGPDIRARSKLVMGSPK